MKKVLIVLLAALLILASTIPVFAYENAGVSEEAENTLFPQVEHFSIEEVKQAEYSAIERSMTPYATRYFSFGTMGPNDIISDFAEYEIQDGETVYLSISSCMWSPHTCDIYIGLYDLDTGDASYYSFSGGSCSGTYTFPNMNEGRYMVYVRNVGSRNITSGSLRYSLS